jgi:hypothetical protein
VANIGEQLPNTDAKVFEVTVKVNEYDPILRPSMTTSNQILTKTFDDVLFVPLEAIHAEDSISFVYTSKSRKQVVIIGEQNENYIIVEKGLNESDEVYLSVPENVERYTLSGEELIPEIKERAAELMRKEEESRIANEQRNGSKAEGQSRPERPKRISSGTN